MRGKKFILGFWSLFVPNFINFKWFDSTFPGERRWLRDTWKFTVASSLSEERMGLGVLITFLFQWFNLLLAHILEPLIGVPCIRRRINSRWVISLKTRRTSRNWAWISFRFRRIRNTRGDSSASKRRRTNFNDWIWNWSIRIGDSSCISWTVGIRTDTATCVRNWSSFYWWD